MNQSLQLRDGRTLGFAEYGNLDGVPVFFFAGLNNARFMRHPDDSIITTLGIRLITVDRPGLGFSTFQPQRRLLHWPSDVAELAHTLHLDRFAVVGASAGGPYALACAYALAPRLTSVTIVSGVAPITVPGLFATLPRSIQMQVLLARRAPYVLAALYRFMRWSLRRNPDKLVHQLLKSLPSRDQAIIRTPGNLPLLVQDMLEAFRQGGYGSAYDLRVISQAWGFRLDAVQPCILLWQGVDDPNVPPAMAQYVAETLPDCQATWLADAGHFLIYSHWCDIMTQVLRAARSET